MVAALEEAATALDRLAAELTQLTERVDPLVAAGGLGASIDAFVLRSAAVIAAAETLDRLAQDVRLSAHLYVNEMSGEETEGMSDREKAILAADIAGFADPSPVSDGTATVLSLYDGDIGGAALSFLGVIPYLGDTAKGLKYGGKLSKLADSADDAVDAYRVTDKLADGAALAKIDDAVGYVRLPSATVREGGYTYVTDTYGRTNMVSGPLKLDPAPRSNVTTKIGHLGNKGDHGGHLIGARFGGSSHPVNIVPQASSVNLKEYKALEEKWARLLKDGHRVEVSVLTRYADSTTIRPDRFEVEYFVDGVHADTVFLYQ